MNHSKVLCIDDDFSNILHETTGFVNLPKFGHTYTIREYVEHPKPGYLLMEIKNEKFKYRKIPGYVAEPTFATRRFVPLDADEIENEIINELELVS